MEATNPHNHIDQQIYYSDEEDTLSLCDLPLQSQQEPTSYYPSLNPKSPSNQDFFEFATNPRLQTDDIIFCGKIIPSKSKDEENDTLDNDQRNSLFPLSSSWLFDDKSLRSRSLHLQSSLKTSSSSPVTSASFRYLQPCGGCNTSRKHKVLIGLARIPPKMELSDIRKRQNRQTPMPLLPVPTDGCEVDGAVVIGRGRRGGSGGRRDHWNLLRPSTSRTHFANAFAKATFGCIRPVV